MVGGAVGKLLKDRRLVDCRAGRPAVIPCNRCVHRYQTEYHLGHFDPCRFGSNMKLWRDMLFAGKQGTRCLHYTQIGQDCLKPPDELKDVWDELARAIEAAEAFRDKERCKEAIEAISRVRNAATDCILGLSQLPKKQSESCYAHDGRSDWEQTGIRLAGRDRKVLSTVARENNKRKREADVEEAMYNTPSKGRFGMLAVEETPGERQQREADEAALRVRQERAQKAAETRPRRRGGKRAAARPEED